MRKVLLLNADNKIMRVISIEKTVKLFIKNKINILKTKNDPNKSFSRIFNGIPEIVSLKNYIYIPQKEILLSKKKIFERDCFTCQYTGKKLDNKTVSVDHVIPLSRGGKNTWTNMVTCCIKINNMKANKTPEEAGLRLIRKPFKPNRIHFLEMNHDWEIFLEQSL